MCSLRSLAAELAGADHQPRAKVHIQHFTDPLSAWCWATEPALLRLSELFGGYVSLEHRMIGLIESLEPEEKSETEEALFQPGQLTMQWEEIAYLSGMPMHCDVWMDGPITSSWPACAAVKAAQIQDPVRAGHYLRRLREAAICHGENVLDSEILQEHPAALGLDGRKLVADLESGTAGAAFTDDRLLANETGAIAPPSFFFFGPAGVAEIRGARPFEDMAAAIEHAAGEKYPMPVSPRSIENRHGYIKALAESRGSLTAPEIGELLELDRSVASDLLDRMAAGGSLRRVKVGSGFLYLPLSRS